MTVIFNEKKWLVNVFYHSCKEQLTETIWQRQKISKLNFLDTFVPSKQHKNATLLQ